MEEILDLRITLRHLGVPLRKLSHIFGDNDSAFNSSMPPHGKAIERHVALSFHRVKEAIESKIVAYHFINGENNPADVLSKHCTHHSVWATLKPFFWKGGTMDCFDNNALEFEEWSWIFLLRFYASMFYFLHLGS